MNNTDIEWVERNIRKSPAEVIHKLEKVIHSDDLIASVLAKSFTAAAWVSARDLNKAEQLAIEVIKLHTNYPNQAFPVRAAAQASLVLAEVHHDRGNLTEFSYYLNMCKAALQSAEHPGLLGGLHLLEAASARKRADHAEVERALGLALLAFDESGDRGAVAGTMNNLAVFFRERGNNPEALRLHIESAAISREMEDWINVGRNEYNQALLLRSAADFEGAITLMESALSIMRKLGEARGEAHVLNGLGSLHLDLKQYNEARFYFEKSLTLKQELKLLSDEAVAWVNLAQTCQGCGDWTAAATFLENAERLALATGNQQLRWSIFLGCALQSAHNHDLTRALENFAKAIQQCAQLGQENERLECVETYYRWYLSLDAQSLERIAHLESFNSLWAMTVPAKIEFHLKELRDSAKAIGNRVRELGFMELLAKFWAKEGKYERAYSVLQCWHHAQADYNRQLTESKLEALSTRYALAEARNKAAFEKLRNEELAKALQCGRELQKQKDYYLAIVAHDLRNPLIGIKGAAQSLTVGMKGENARLLSSIAYSATKGLALINDLLDLDKLDQQGFSFSVESFDLCQLLHELAQEHDWHVQEKQVELILPQGQSWVNADRPRLAQVLQNLILNAISFSPVTGVIRVELDRFETYVRVQIKDQGPGVPVEARALLFHKYRLIEAVSPKGPGRASSGLGLAVAAGFIQGMGGSIYYEQQDGWGSVFCLEIPA